MTKEKRCAVVKEVFSSLMLAEDNTAIYMEEMMYCVRNNIGQFLIVKARSEDEALKKAEVTKSEWVSCELPPSNERNVFLARGTDDFKSCCIGHYDHKMKRWYEDRNWFASPIYDCEYWCDMPTLPNFGSKRSEVTE